MASAGRGCKLQLSYVLIMSCGNGANGFREKALAFRLQTCVGSRFRFSDLPDTLKTFGLENEAATVKCVLDREASSSPAAA